MKKVKVFVRMEYDGVMKDKDEDVSNIEIDWDSGENVHWLRIEDENGDVIWEA